MHPVMQVYCQEFSLCDTQLYVLNITSVTWSNFAYIIYKDFNFDHPLMIKLKFDAIFF